MKGLLWLGMLGALVALGGAATPYVCYGSDPNPYLQFGSKTSYEFSSGRTAGPGGQGEMKGIPGCRPLIVWMVARHGARNPNLSEIDRFKQISKLKDEIIRNHFEEKTSTLCPTDAQNLQQWQSSFNVMDEDQISTQGKEDMNLFAKRLRTRFDELIGTDYNEQNFVFQHTTTKKARGSAEAFADGLFPNVQVKIQSSIKNDSMLRSYSNCPAWEAMVDSNPETLKQLDLYLALPEFGKVVYSISQRLGFRFNLTQDTILYAYDICRFEKANNIKVVSPWCALFTPDELKVIEYAEDLRYYYNSGYGNSLNLKMGCPLVQDMMFRLRNVANGVPEPSGVFYFTHQTSLLTLLARMGVANDASPPTHGNYESQSRRQWKTSALSPFNGNLMVVFFNCTGNSGNTEQKIVFYLQESVLPLPGCEAGICSWNFIRDKFLSIAEECNVVRTCAGLDSSATEATLSISALILLLVTIININ